MIVDRLVIHHTYDGRTAFDISQNHNHGRLEGVGVSGGVATFDGGPDCVRVPRSTSLDRMRAVRTTVRFKVPKGLWAVDPWYSGGPRRMNLIEGYLSFALVIDHDRALHGTILDRSGHWNGVRSTPGAVTFGQWHEATFLHDGFSACSLSLDGVTLATGFDVPGPVSSPKAPHGVAIGHWPDPDDRYSFIGEIGEVKVWVDRIEVLSDLVDDCCMDREKAGELFDDLRGEAFDDPGFDAAAYEHAANTMLDLGSKTAGAMAAGSAADRQRAWDLGARFQLAFSTGNRDAFLHCLGEGVQLAGAKVPEAQLNADSAAVITALQPTLLGPLARAVADGAGPNRQAGILHKLGLDQWMEALCAGWAVPPKPPRKDDGDGKDDDKDDGGGKDGDDKDGRGDRTGAGTTDRDPGDMPPSWGAGGEHVDGPLPVPPDDSDTDTDTDDDTDDTDDPGVHP